MVRVLPLLGKIRLYCVLHLSYGCITTNIRWIFYTDFRSESFSRARANDRRQLTRTASPGRRKNGRPLAETARARARAVWRTRGWATGTGFVCREACTRCRTMTSDMARLGTITRTGSGRSGGERTVVQEAATVVGSARRDECWRPGKSLARWCRPLCDV